MNNIFMSQISCDTSTSLEFQLLSEDRDWSCDGLTYVSGSL
jgi:hypothetical protein